MTKVRYQDLPAGDRRDALRFAQESGKHRAFLLEKDVWIVAALEALYGTPFAPHLTFKGGTSLSKAWGVIRRFSEDIDITYDIRAFATDLVSDAGEEARPPTRSQERRWTRAIRARLAEWVRTEASQVIEDGLTQAGFVPRVQPDGDRLYIGYETLFEETGFVRPEVMIEFGARSTGEPHTVLPVVCDAAGCMPDLAFPEVQPTVMLAERTFWEKATAIHVFCRQERRRGDRLSRHWHDLARLDETGVAVNALADRALALSVARHKAAFFAENDAHGERIDYEAAVSERLRLVPSGTAYAVLANDHSKMLADGMLLDEGEPFSLLMEKCAAIETRANASRLEGA